MSRNVEAESVFFSREQLVVSPRVCTGQRRIGKLIRCRGERSEQIVLSRCARPLYPLTAFNHEIDGLEQLSSIGPQGVEGARTNQALQAALVDGPGIHPFGEIEYGSE